MRFWEKENTTARLRERYPDWVKERLPNDDYFKSSRAAHPIYRMTGAYLDYEKLLSGGIPGMHALIDEREAKARETGESIDFELLDGFRAALDILADSLLFYAVQVRESAYAADTDSLRRKQLENIADACANVAVRKPETLLEAIELSWIYSLLSGTMNYGRMDDYLGEYLVADLESGRLTVNEAQDLVCSYWEIINSRHTRVHSRVIIGDRGRKNPEAADRFGLLAIEASRRVKEIEPQLTLRLDDDTPKEIRDLAMLCIKEGRTYPLLYDDRVNIPAVMRAFRADEKTAEQYMPFGCGEYVINHQSFGTPSGVINLLKCLELALNHGVDMFSGEDSGFDTGGLDTYKNFEELWDGYRRQVEYYTDALALQEKMEYDMAGEEAPYFFLSMLFDDCIERAKPIFAGGIRRLGGTIESYGNMNTADSLTAIKKLVYDDKLISAGELTEALRSDFEGFAPLRRELVEAPKFGNDDDYADSIAARVHDHICLYSSSCAAKVGLDSYLVVIINNETNTILGRNTAASADGRRKGTFMANAINPQGGADKNGLTAMLNSLVKMDNTIHAGGVQNIKLNREIFEKHRDQLDAMLDTYFDNGGQQAMLTVLNRDDLENAIKNPKDYQNLFVRVGGFSARFVTLDRDVQEEILSRTMY